MVLVDGELPYTTQKGVAYSDGCGLFETFMCFGKAQKSCSLFSGFMILEIRGN